MKCVFTNAHRTGLYCPNAPHTWKVVFEADHRVYEVLLSACSDAEQNMWTNLTQERISTETQDYREYNFTNTSLRVSTPSDIRSIGEAVGRPGTLARHQSLHRNASASALECNGRYIIINSLLSSTDPSYSSDKPIKRSYSAPTVNDRSGVPIINLKRSERNQIEAKLEDVWTKELLPYNATQVVKEPNGIKRLSMMSLISHKKSTSSTSSASEYSDYTVFEDDDGDGDKAIRRQSMKSFRSKSSSPRSTPPSPTKRSSSLRSRLSLGSSTKNSPVSASDTLSSNLSSQRRNMRPLPEGKRKLSERSEAALMNTIYMSPVTTSDTNPEWESQDSYFSINKPVAPPTPPTSVQEDGGSVNKAKVAGLRKDGKRTMSLQLAGAVKEDPACNRRHTLVIHQSSRPWRTARRKKVKRPSQDISREWKAPEKMTPQALMSVKHGLL